VKHYSKFSGLFVYPRKEALITTVSQVQDILVQGYPTLAGGLDEFSAFAHAHSDDALSEYYIKTFDVMASCYLDIGYVLFGEDYRRGEFLVNLLNEHIKAENDCGKELPDHLPNMLNLLPKIADQLFAQELAYSIMIPALKEMLKNFIDEVNVYKKLLEVLIKVMEIDFKDLNFKQFELLNNDKTNFLNNINCKP